MTDEADDKKTVVIKGASPQRHQALAAYAAVHNVSMADAFDRAVMGLTEKLDGAERVIFDRYMAAPADAGFKRRGRKTGGKVDGQ